MRMIGQELPHVVTGAEAQKIERHAHRCRSERCAAATSVRA
jgi:hypothetical protein